MKHTFIATNHKSIFTTPQVRHNEPLLAYLRRTPLMTFQIHGLVATKAPFQNKFKKEPTFHPRLTHQFPFPHPVSPPPPISSPASLPSMAPKKQVPKKFKTTPGPSSCQHTPPPEDLDRLIIYAAERLYHDSLYNRTFMPEQGFTNSNAYFSYWVQRKGWGKICEHPP